MKLVYRILLHMSWALSLLLAAWAVLFYFTMIDEINDEVDDSLENYAEVLVKRNLAGRELPAAFSGRPTSPTMTQWIVPSPKSAPFKWRRNGAKR